MEDEDTMAEQTDNAEGEENLHMSPEKIRSKIVHLLSIYPIISPTMLQVGLGPQVKPENWRPVLMSLIESGIVMEESETRMTPFSRSNTYNKLRLTEGGVELQQAG